MNDVTHLLGVYLDSVDPINSHVGDRIWADTDLPDEQYRPDHGGGLAFKVRGGGLEETTEARVIRASFQFKCYGHGRAGADMTYRLLVQSLDGKSGGGVKWAYLEQLGTMLTEPDTDWPFVVAFFTAFFNRTEV